MIARRYAESTCRADAALDYRLQYLSCCGRIGVNVELGR